MPRISIGMPVFNGERYLRETLTSIREQTLEDFALTICDNASTDGTQSIAREFVALDRRFRYHRNTENIGAAPNFNRVFALAADAPYFKWAAVDDRCAPTFLERCVELLDRDAGAVLAYTRIGIIDDEGRPVESLVGRLSTDCPRPSRRFAALLRGHGAHEIFGVVRRDLLARTPLIGSYSRGDIVLLARLALHGRFEQVPEELFLARRHAGQSMAMIGNWAEYAAWFDPRHKGRRVYPRWRWSLEYLKCVAAAPIGVDERLRCVYFLGRHVWKIRRWLVWEIRSNLGRPRATVRP